ncbi:MAG: hypothetical protein AAF969_01690 [Bacteroidota bacterium]
MTLLTPIFSNDAGVAYQIKRGDKALEKIQLQIGDIAALMNFNEIKDFLRVIRLVKQGCSRCGLSEDKALRSIKFLTSVAEVKFKSDIKMINDLEELVLEILVYSKLQSLMMDNKIDFSEND